MRKTLLTLGLAFLCPILVAQQALNNDGVIKLIKAGLSDDLIVTTINGSAGSYDISADGIVALKTAGASERVIATILAKKSDSTAPQQSGTDANTTPAQAASAAATPAGSPVVAPVKGQPRVYLQSASKGPNRNAARDQSMEMSKDFEQNCPGVKITINQQAADYTVLLNHIEVGLLVRDNQFQIANRDGDLISKTKEGGSIAAGIKKACTIILDDWAKK